MKLSFNIARRFLAYNKGQTLLIVLGIAIGISVQIFIGLLISGLQDSLIDSTIGSSAHITISSETRGENFNFDADYLSELKDMENFTHVGVSVSGPAFGVYDEKSQSILLRGLDDEVLDINNLEGKIIEGTLDLYRGIVIGKGLAEQLEIGVNDELIIQTINNNTYNLNVSGIADFKVAALNDSWVISKPIVVQNILELADQISAIEIQVDEVFNADLYAASLSIPTGLSVIDWKEQNAELLSGLNGQSVSTYMIQVFVLVSVVLGIASTLAITVLQKSKQIGILKAMGIPDTQASLIFIFQGIILGFLGGLLGMGLGYGLLEMFSTFAKGADGNPIIPITFDLQFILFSGSIAVISSFIASLIPARKSLKLTVIEVIRNG